jgi:hypothetical protein
MVVSVTRAPAAHITKSPRKLQTPAIQAAERKRIAPVETAQAMALGASVQPLTKTTHTVSINIALCAIRHPAKILAP